MSEFERVSLETCHLPWYVKRLMVTFGRPFALRILKRDLTTVATFARVNELKAQNGASFSEQLHSSKVKGVENVYVLEKGGRADARAKLASSGEIAIQDLGSIVAGLVTAPKAGQVILDVCASPGTKTSHLAAQMGNNGKIYSVEISANRSLQWRREMTRTGCTIATLIIADARKLPIRIQTDVVLVDPPCSNTGVFARDPTSKWRLTPARLRELVRAQGEILQEASERLSEGGTLVYCTCSILPEENELVIERFLKKNPRYALTRQEPFLGSPGLRGLSDCQRFFPHLHNCNGYFIAKMRKG
jgi:16S rRNA (cytosine967-C5)-methyltransferase